MSGNAEDATAKCRPGCVERQSGGMFACDCHRGPDPHPEDVRRAFEQGTLIITAQLAREGKGR